MVSRRNFFAIFLMMFVVLFLCQFSQIMRENMNRNNNDAYRSLEVPGSGDEWDMKRDLESGVRPDREIIFVGDPGSEVGQTVAKWCRLIKADLSAYEELPAYGFENTRYADAVLIDGENADLWGYLPYLKDYVKNDAIVVFCTLPDSSVIKQNKKLRDLLGITGISDEEVTVEGIRVFDGTFVGGEAVYKVNEEKYKDLQDLDLTMPWYITAEGSKSYVVGMLDDEIYERESFPRIVWRYTGDNIKVFAVNGDYMKSDVGFGLLDMFLYESSDYALYPVVNAQSTMFLDAPCFSGENDAAMQENYSRNTSSAQRDIFLPGIISVSTTNNLAPTFMVQTKYDLGSPAVPDMEELDFFAEQAGGLSGELGRSLRYTGAGIEDKILIERSVYENLAHPYHFRAFYADSMEDVLKGPECPLGIKTLVTADDLDELFFYASDDMTWQSITFNADKYSYSADMLARSLNTSVGYSMLSVDLHNVLWPESEKDQWQLYFDDIFSNISTYWKRLSPYQQTTVSESDVRIRRFLALDYSSEYVEGDSYDTVTLDVTNGGNDCYFLLRTHDQKIDRIAGAGFSAIGEDAYLLHVTGDHVTIILNDSENVLNYNSPFGR